MVEQIKEMLEDTKGLLNEIHTDNGTTKILAHSYLYDSLDKLAIKNGFNKEKAFVKLMKQWIILLKEEEVYQCYDDTKLIHTVFLTSDLTKLEISEVKKSEVLLRDEIYIYLDEDDFKNSELLESFEEFEIFLIRNGEQIEICIGIADSLAFMYRKDFRRSKSTKINEYVDNINQLFSEGKGFIAKVKAMPELCLGDQDNFEAENLLVYLLENLIRVNKIKFMAFEILEDNFFRVKGKREIRPIKNQMESLLTIFALSDEFEIKQNNVILKGKKGKIIDSNKLEEDSEDFNLLFNFNDQIVNLDERIDYYRLFERMREFILLNNEEKLILKDKENINVIHSGAGLKTLLLQNLDTSYLPWNDPFKIEFSKDDIYVQTCFLLSYFDTDVQKSYVNCRRTHDGGSHVEGLISGVKKAFEKYFLKYSNPLGNPDYKCLENNSTLNNIIEIFFDTESQEYRSAEKLFNEFAKKMNYVINVEIDEPRYSDVMKRKLYNLELKSYIEEKVCDQLFDFLEEKVDIFTY